MCNEEIALEEVLCEVVKGAVFGAETVSSSDAGDTGKLVHVLDGRLAVPSLG